MGYLEKNFLLHERDEKGNLIPIDYKVEDLGGQLIQVTPTSRGEQLRMARQLENNKQSDMKPEEMQEANLKIWIKYVLDHLLKPELTEEDLRTAKLIKVNGIVKDIVFIISNAIDDASGIEISTEQSEEDLKKK